MTFAARESSRLNGRPFHLYTIRFGPEAASARYYTNLTTSFAYGLDADDNPIIYQPLPISHGEIVSSGNLDRSNMPVRIPDEGDIPDLFRDGSPSNVVTVTIRQAHHGDGDVKVCWAGKTVGYSFEGVEMVLECESIAASMRRPGLTRKQQLMCPLVLYGAQCRASKAAATITRPVVAIDGAIVTLSSAWETSHRKDKYLGGMAEWTSPAGRLERRRIVRRPDDETLILDAPTTTLIAGADLSLTLGCDHTMDDCQYLHDNIQNYGGQPATPLVNPVGITNNYY